MPFPWMGCFDHLLQLVANIPYSKSPSITLEKARDIVGHFNSSTQAEKRLLVIQEQIDPSVNAKSLIQDVRTRWWSTYNLCNRLVELERAVTAVVPPRLSLNPRNGRS